MKKSLSLILSIACLLVFALLATASNEQKEPETAETGFITENAVTEDVFSTYPVQYETEQTVTQTGSDDTQAALEKAVALFKYQAFSYNGVIDMLEYEGFSTEAATYAADNCGADWNEQALKKAEEYLGFSGYSYDAMLTILNADGFTADEITYALENCDVDWNEEAAQAAESLVVYSGINTKEALVEELEYAGFTHEQAVYGAEQNGF